MPTWIHDDDTLRYLAEENGPVRDWAAFHALARGLSSVRPTAAAYAPVAALLGEEGPVDDWGRQVLADPTSIPDLLLLARAGELVPEDPGAWSPPLVEALTSVQGAAAADLLVVLGRLEVAHLPVLLERHPASTTWLAWLAGVATPHDLGTEIAQRIQADHDANGPELVDSVALVTVPCVVRHRSAEEAFVAGCREAGRDVPPLGRGSTHRRVQRGLRALVPVLKPPARVLVEALLDTGAPVPPAVAFCVARQGAERPIPLSLPEHPARALHVAAGVAVDPDHVLELLEQDRPLGLRVARFTPTVEVMEALLALPVPADPEERFDLALALAMLAQPATATALRGILAHVDRVDRQVVERVYAELLDTPL